MKQKLCTALFILFAFAQSSIAAEQKSANRQDIAKVAYLTCAEAWERAGQSDEKIIKMIKSMAGYSLAKRHLSFPNTKEDGIAVGNMIKERCSSNPDESLLSIVDRSLRDHLKKAS